VATSKKTTRKREIRNDAVSRLCKEIMKDSRKLTFESLDEDLLVRACLAIMADARWPSYRYRALSILMEKRYKLQKQPGSGRPSEDEAEDELEGFEDDELEGLV